MDKTDLSADPLDQFRRWYGEAETAEVAQPEAIALATAGPDGAPSLRMVLLKQFDEQGFAFFTNLGSRKARELEANPRAALLSFWQPLGRQVRVEGAITAVNRDEVEHYARRRSRDSQLSALASPQSEVIESREWLEQRMAELEGAHPQGDLPVAPGWGGFRLSPGTYEFWQQGAHRLHDRFRYLREPEGWRIERLAP
jgi:pyridoxamine 5'-phosphate oxidase